VTACDNSVQAFTFPEVNIHVFWLLHLKKCYNKDCYFHFWNNHGNSCPKMWKTLVVKFIGLKENLKFKLNSGFTTIISWRTTGFLWWPCKSFRRKLLYGKNSSLDGRKKWAKPLLQSINCLLCGSFTTISETKWFYSNKKLDHFLWYLLLTRVVLICCNIRVLLMEFWPDLLHLSITSTLTNQELLW